MKYYISTQIHGEKEVDKETYIAYEQAAGFISKFGRDAVATASFFFGGLISGRVDYSEKVETPNLISEAPKVCSRSTDCAYIRVEGHCKGVTCKVYDPITALESAERDLGDRDLDDGC